MGMGEKLEEWEYANFSNAADVETYCENLLNFLSINSQEIFLILKDTRPTHKKMFEMVVPVGREYLAGNYRGANYPQLIDRPVYVQTVYGYYDSGAPCDKVHEFMDEFHVQIGQALNALKTQSVNWNPTQKIIAYTKFVGSCFVNFLAIHPYANGNGHISRLLVWCLFAIKSISCNFWNVPKRNSLPTNQMVTDFRRKNFTPLFKCFLDLISNENKDINLQ